MKTTLEVREKTPLVKEIYRKIQNCKPIKPALNLIINKDNISKITYLCMNFLKRLELIEAIEKV